MALPAVRQVGEFGRSLITLPAPKGSRTVWSCGDILLDNMVPHVLVDIRDGVSGDEVIGQYGGEYEITCDTGTTASAGADAYYDEANRKIVTAPGADIILVGKFEKAKTSGQLVATVRLNGQAGFFTGGITRNKRIRVTLAQLNAGYELLPAVPGFKYRLIDATIIAIGGAATAATAVIVTATQAASVVSLLSAAVAALTRSAVVKPDTANVTVLADGASFVQNDANTAVNIAKTGSAMTTATHFDVILTYELDV